MRAAGEYAGPDTAQPASARLADAVERLSLWAAGGVLSVLLAVVLVAVAARYLFGSSIPWAEAAALWLHVALVFVGLPLASRGAGAVRLDIISRRVGDRTRRVLEVVAEAVVLHAGLVLLFGAAAVMERIGGVSTTLDLPESWRFAPVIAGAGLTVLITILRALAERRAFRGAAALLMGCGLFLAGQFVAFEPRLQPSLVAGGFAFLVLLAGAPLPHALISGLSLAVSFGSPLPEPAVVQNTVAGIGRFLLLAIPFFLLTGSLITVGGLGERLMRLAQSLVGHWRGGTAQTTLLTSLMISGVSGSSVADAAFGAKVLAPELVKAGHKPERAAAIVASASILPNIVPPSIAFLILALATDLSVGALFAGGLTAGLLLAATLALAFRFLSPEASRPRAAGRAERQAAFLAALPALGLALVIVAGIRFGVVTTTEAAALAALYALAVAVLSRKDGRAIALAFAEAGRDAASVGLLIGTAAPLVFLLSVDGVPALVSELFAGVESVLAILLLANLVLLVAGSVIDIGAAILLLAPLLMPAAIAAGIDPIRFGVVMVVNLMIGGLTPPVGILVYVSAQFSGVSPSQVFRSALPLVGALLTALAVLSGFAAMRTS